MAFKMRGFNPGKGTGLGSAFTKASPMKIDPPAEKKEEGDVKLKRSERPTPKETRAAEYKAVEGTETETSPPDYEQKYSEEEIAKGAHAATDFDRKEGGGQYKTKKKLKTGKSYQKKSGSARTKKTGGPGEKGTQKGIPTIYTEDVIKRDRKGKAKKTKGKKIAKTNIFTGKKTMKIDPIDKKEDRVKGEERRHKRDTGEDAYLGPGTARKDVDWAFEGGTKQDKDISKRKRKAQFDPKTGKIKEKYKSTLGFYRKTGRELDAKAYQEAGREKQAGPSKKEKKKAEKEKEKAGKPTWKEERARINKQHADKDAAEQAARVKEIEARKNK